MKTKKILLLLVIALLLTSVGLSVVQVSAESNYSYYLPDDSRIGYYIPLAYETERTITYIEELDEQIRSAQDMFLTDDYLYILDSDNARIVILTHDGDFVAEYGGEFGTITSGEGERLKAEIKAKYFKAVWNGKVKDEEDKEVEVTKEEDLVVYVNEETNEVKAIPESQLPENLAANPNANDGFTMTEVLRDGMENGDYVHENRVVDAMVIKAFSTPKGIYVDKEGDIFVADTGNSRLIHLSPEGEFVELFVEPDSEMFDYEEYPFKPAKLYIDSVGRIYVINDRDYHGFIIIDAQNEFRGYVAQSSIEYDWVHEFLKLIYSEEIMAEIEARETPPYFSNFIIRDSESDPLIYAVAQNDTKDQIKRLTPAGNNVYEPGTYGSTGMDDAGNDTYASFIDIAVGTTGLVYAADASTQEIYIYDSEGNSVAVIGGQGNYKGTFGNISAIALNEEGTLYVLDREKNTIQIMQPTKFMKKVMEASVLYSDGKYNEALGPWDEVLEMHNSYNLAVKGKAKAMYGNYEYEVAMDLYKLARDQEGYSEAYYEWRLEAFRENFGVVVVVIILLIVGLLALIIFLYKLAGKVDLVYDYSGDKYGIKLFFHSLLMIIFHPIDGYNKLKANRDRYRWWMVAVMILAILVVRIAYIYIVHFPLADSLPQNTDLVQEVVVYLLPLAAWTIIGFGVTSISDGKTTFKESCISNLLAFTPYIIFTLPLGLLSNVMCQNEGGLYVGIQSAILLWAIALMLLGLMNLNEYSFKKMVTTTLIILFAIVCVFLLVGMFYIILNQFVVFIEEVNVELVYMQNSIR